MKKPSMAEEEFIARQEAEKKRQLSLQLIKETAAREREKLQKLHFMHCPKCGLDLQEIAYGGVLVDKCFGCNGIWLDDGELDKLVNAEKTWSKAMRFFGRKEYQSENG